MILNAIAIESYNILDMLEERITCRVKMKKTLAYLKKFICILRENIKGKKSSNNSDQEYPCIIKVADIQAAEIIIIKLHQIRYFKNEISIPIRMRNGEEVSLQISSNTSNINPSINENEILHVGGSIKQSNLNTEYVHPCDTFAKWYHQSLGCGGRGYNLQKIRPLGYWTVKANSVVRYFFARRARW